jgi:hypothetical protein
MNYNDIHEAYNHDLYMINKDLEDGFIDVTDYLRIRANLENNFIDEIEHLRRNEK